jgi:hypothetical protein
MRLARLGVTVTLALLALPALAQQALDRPLEEPRPLFRDSGNLINATAVSRNLHTERVAVTDAGWIRLYFGDVKLGPGSFLRLQSELDGEVQELDAEALERWSRSSAYFNGEAVTVQVVAAPGTTNRLIVERVASAPGVPTESCGICGSDDRVSSGELWSARLLPAGCTASIFDDQSCAVSAGHCISGSMVLQFNVPPSSANCNINMPPVADQFPVASFLFSNGGVGQDWSVMTTGVNNLGQKAFQRYGVFKPIAGSPPAVGQPLQIWGYGVDDTCTLSQTQQTSVGSVTAVSTTLINHDVDATFGNSGSGIVRSGSEILAIATHCPCPNWATRVDHPSFAAARASLCPQAPALPATLSGFTILQGTLASGGLSELAASDDSYLQLQSAVAGTRHNAIFEVTLQSPLTTVTELNVTVEIGPANATPVFHAVSIFNYDTGLYENQAFSTTSTTSDTVDNFNGISNPNAHVSDSGEIKIRLVHTARKVQIPDGFLGLFDQVAATVRP